MCDAANQVNLEANEPRAHNKFCDFPEKEEINSHRTHNFSQHLMLCIQITWKEIIWVLLKLLVLFSVMKEF